MIRLIAQQLTVDAAAGDDTPKRTITGIAVPWNVDAVESGGTRVRFEPGSLAADGPAPKLLGYHDDRQVIGIVTERVATDDAMLFTARVSATRAGDDFLALAVDGAIDSVSVGAIPTKWTMDGDTMVIQSADWAELSLVPFPAFSEAAITKVAASADPAPIEEADTPDTEPNPHMEDTTMTTEPTPVEAAAASVVPTAPIPAVAASRKLPTPGEYIAAMRRGGHDWHQFNDNVRKVLAATGDVLVADAAGVVPTPILGPVYDDVNALRPLVGALGARSMPDAGATFIRPYVKVHSSAAAQSSELAALSTADFEVDDIVVTKKTFGGKLVLSEQVIDWSAPSMLDQAIADLSGQYALATEKYVVDQMAAAITNTQEVIVTDWTDEAEVIGDLFTAASSIAATGNYLPNAVAVSPTIWAKLGSLVDGQGRPIFPMMSPMNANGQMAGVTSYNGNPLGLNLVVSNQIGSQAVGNKTATEYAWLMNTRGVEVYESYKGFLRDESAGTLGVTIAVRGYFAAHVIDKNMIRILGPDATF